MLHPILDEEHPSHKHFRHRNPFIPPTGDLCPINNLPTELLSRIFQFGIEDIQDPVIIRASDCIQSYRLANESGHANNNGATDDGINTENEVEEGTGDVHFADDTEEIGQPSGDAPSRLLHPFQTVVAHVCQHWRNAAISTASLWTSITISPVSQPPYQHVVALLERSKRLLIDIRIRFGSEEHDIHSPLESTPAMTGLELLSSLLVAHIHRWRSFEVWAVSLQQMYTFLHAVSHPTVAAASHLTSLVLSADQPTRDRAFWSPTIEGSFILFGGSAPCLESVSLERVFIDWNQNWISCASRLTTLELRGHPETVSPSWDEFTTILRGAPALERLALHHSEPCGDPPNLDTDPNLEMEATERDAPVQLLKLTHLSLFFLSRYCVYGLLRTLYMPALRSLAIDFFWNDYTEFLSYITAPATVPDTLSTEEQPRSLLRGLEKLDINCLLCPTEVIEILYYELENIKSLKISMDDFWYPLSGCALILPLLPPTAHGQGSVNLRLPQLQTLSISDASSNHHLQVIRQVVQQRNDAGFPLKSLYLEGTRDVGEEDMAWFKENMETFMFSRQRTKQGTGYQTWRPLCFPGSVLSRERDIDDQVLYI